jgi:hypothetical protein
MALLLERPLWRLIMVLPSPAGAQVAFLGEPGASYIQQVIYWQPGSSIESIILQSNERGPIAVATYWCTLLRVCLSLQEALRETLELMLNTNWVLIDTQQSCESGWTAGSSDNFVTSAATGAIRFRASVNTLMVDGVELVLVSAAPSPVPTPAPYVATVPNGDIEVFNATYGPGQSSGSALQNSWANQWSFGSAAGVTTQGGDPNMYTQSGFGTTVLYITSPSPPSYSYVMSNAIDWLPNQPYYIEFSFTKRAAFDPMYFEVLYTEPARQIRRT